VCAPFPGAAVSRAYGTFLDEVLMLVAGPAKYTLRRISIQLVDQHHRHIARSCIAYFDSTTESTEQRLAEAFGF